MSWIHLDGSEKPHFQTPNHSDVNPRIQCPSWGPMLFSSQKKAFCPTAALISQWHLFLPILGCIKSHSWVFCHYEPLFTTMNPMIIPFYSHSRHSHTKVRTSYPVVAICCAPCGLTPLLPPRSRARQQPELQPSQRRSPGGVRRVKRFVGFIPIWKSQNHNETPKYYTIWNQRFVGSKCGNKIN
jgi:hypothetical protein